MAIPATLFLVGVSLLMLGLFAITGGMLAMIISLPAWIVLSALFEHDTAIALSPFFTNFLLSTVISGVLYILLGLLTRRPPGGSSGPASPGANST